MKARSGPFPRPRPDTVARSGSIGGVEHGAVSWWPLAAGCLGTFLLLLYTSIVTVALPRIGTDLDAGFAAQQWVVDVYTVALAGLLMGAGAIGDAYGTRRVYLIGLVGFSGATLVCGIAPTVGWLIAARAAQGVTGAAMFATIPPLIGLVYVQPRQKAVAFAVWGAVAGAAAAVGTVSGGLLAQYAGWRWLFLGAFPICVFGLVLAARVMPRRSESGRKSHQRAVHIDWCGIALITTSVTSLAYGVIAAGESSWQSAGAIYGVLLAVAAAIGFVSVERTITHPMLPVGLLTSPQFAGVLVAAFAYYFATFGALPGIATWMQTRLGLGALAVSLVLVAQLIVFISVSGLLSHRLQHLHPSWTLGAATIVVGLGALTGVAVAAIPDWPIILPFLILSGLGAGIVSPVLPSVALAAAPNRYAGAASSAANAARQLGLSLGVATCGTLSRNSESSGIALALAVCGALAVIAGVAVAVLLHRSDS